MDKIGRLNTPLPNYIMTNRASYGKILKMAECKTTSCVCSTVWLVAMTLYCLCVAKQKCRWQGPSECGAKSLCEYYLTHTLPADCDKQRVCQGTHFAELVTIKNLFKVRIIVFSISGDGIATVELRSRLPRCDWKGMTMVVHNKYLSYIKRVDALARAYAWYICETLYTCSNGLVSIRSYLQHWVFFP